MTLVTGSRKGIGKALVEHFAARGHRVVGCSRKDPDWSLEGYVHYALDVSDEKAVKSLFSELRRDHGGLDHLINNAGIASMNHSLLTPVSTVEQILSTNVTGTFLLSREAAKLMRRRRFGRIVNFTSVAVALKLAGEAAYVASKAAVLGLTQVLARELAEFGITVNAIGPVPIETDLLRGVSEEQLARLLEQQAVRRMGTFEDVINVVDFFLRPESAMVTGQHIYLGGV